MDTALPQKFPFTLDRNLVKANCTGNRVCTSCDIVVLGIGLYTNVSIWKSSVLYDSLLGVVMQLSHMCDMFTYGCAFL